MSADFFLFLIQNMGSPMVAGRNFPQSDIPIGIVYIGDSFATRFECFCRARAMSKGPATRGDFVSDIVDDARADAIFATLKTIRITLSNADRAILHLGSNEPKQLAADIFKSPAVSFAWTVLGKLLSVNCVIATRLSPHRVSDTLSGRDTTCWLTRSTPNYGV